MHHSAKWLARCTTVKNCTVNPALRFSIQSPSSPSRVPSPGPAVRRPGSTAGELVRYTTKVHLHPATRPTLRTPRRHHARSRRRRALPSVLSPRTGDREPAWLGEVVWRWGTGDVEHMVHTRRDAQLVRYCVHIVYFAQAQTQAHAQACGMYERSCFHA